MAKRSPTNTDLQKQLEKGFTQVHSRLENLENSVNTLNTFKAVQEDRDTRPIKAQSVNPDLIKLAIALTSIISALVLASKVQ